MMGLFKRLPRVYQVVTFFIGLIGTLVTLNELLPGELIKTAFSQPVCIPLAFFLFYLIGVPSVFYIWPQLTNGFAAYDTSFDVHELLSELEQYSALESRLLGILSDNLSHDFGDLIRKLGLSPRDAAAHQALYGVLHHLEQSGQIEASAGHYRKKFRF